MEFDIIYLRSLIHFLEALHVFVEDKHSQHCHEHSNYKQDKDNKDVYFELMSTVDLRLPRSKHSPSHDYARKGDINELVVEDRAIVEDPVDLPRSIVGPDPNDKQKVKD